MASELIEQDGYRIHPSSTVQDGAVVGKGTLIWQFCTVLSGAVIGEDCALSQGVFIEGKARIGNRVKVKNNVTVYDLVTLEDDVFCGPSCVFTNDFTPRSHYPRHDSLLPTHVCEGATIGANATVVCGVTIGRYTLIGAGSVVTADTSDFSLVYGVPARQRGWVCHCGLTLAIGRNQPEVACTGCGSSYRYAGKARKVEEIELVPYPGRRPADADSGGS